MKLSSVLTTVSFGTLALSAPISTRDIQTQGELTNFVPDQCGATSFELSGTGIASTKADCQALVDGLRGKGMHWSINNGFGPPTPAWLNIATSGTCHFWVNRRNFPDANIAASTRIGTDDVADIVQDSIARFSNDLTLHGPGVGTASLVSPGKGTANCFSGDQGKVPWQIRSDNPN